MRADDASATENARMTFLGRLVPLSRAVRMGDDGLSIILANGLDYPIFPAFREASATVIKRKDEFALLPASTNRSLWRQLSAISVNRRAAVDAVCGPMALNHQITASETTLWVGALVTDKAKIEDVVGSTYSLPAGMFTDFGRAAYEHGVAFAEERESLMIQGVKAYASELKCAFPAYDRSRQHFWTRVEQNLSSLFDLARNDRQAVDIPNTLWGKTVLGSALAAYEQACPRQTPRQIQAYALGLRKLTLIPKPTKSNPARP